MFPILLTLFGCERKGELRLEHDGKDYECECKMIDPEKSEVLCGCDEVKDVYIDDSEANKPYFVKWHSVI
jgi:hypothetical protein